MGNVFLIEGYEYAYEIFANAILVTYALSFRENSTEIWTLLMSEIRSKKHDIMTAINTMSRNHSIDSEVKYPFIVSGYQGVGDLVYIDIRTVVKVYYDAENRKIYLYERARDKPNLANFIDSVSNVLKIPHSRAFDLVFININIDKTPLKFYTPQICELYYKMVLPKRSVTIGDSSYNEGW